MCSGSVSDCCVLGKELVTLSGHYDFIFKELFGILAIVPYETVPNGVSLFTMLHYGSSAVTFNLDQHWSR